MQIMFTYKSNLLTCLLNSKYYITGGSFSIIVTVISAADTSYQSQITQSIDQNLSSIVLTLKKQVPVALSMQVLPWSKIANHLILILASLLFNIMTITSWACILIPSGKSTTRQILTHISSPSEGSLSDSATGMLTVDGKERRRVTNGKQGPGGGLSKKSSSTSKLSDTGRTGVFLSQGSWGGCRLVPSDREWQYK